tara:strand:+ start:2184 stop:2648 length:465 start_codon:yes stop_codon:yes gene_type:complete
MVSEQEIQQMYMQFQMMKQQMDEAVQNKQLLDQKRMEVIATKSAIADLKKTKKGDEIWTPLGTDSFISAKLEDVSKVAVNVGANVIVKKSLPEAVKLMENKEKELQEIDKKMTSHMQQLGAQMQMLEQAMQSAISEAQNPKQAKTKNIKKKSSK